MYQDPLPEITPPYPCCLRDRDQNACRISTSIRLGWFPPPAVALNVPAVAAPS